MKYYLLAACIMHVEGFYSTKSLAFRDKNPGNLRSTKTLKFNIYPSILLGFSALVSDIMSNKGKTLKEFISKYAPPNENNTNLYLETVSILSEIKPEDIL